LYLALRLLLCGDLRVTQAEPELSYRLLLLGLPLAQRLALRQNRRDLGVLVFAQLNLNSRAGPGSVTASPARY